MVVVFINQIFQNLIFTFLNIQFLKNVVYLSLDILSCTCFNGSRWDSALYQIGPSAFFTENNLENFGIFQNHFPAKTVFRIPSHSREHPGLG